MKKQDFLLIGGILLIAGMAAVLFSLKARQPGAVIQIRTGDAITGEYSLAEETELVLDGADGGKNTLVIRGGEVWMTEADCPDRLCVKQSRISKNGQMIVCLPHKIMITVIDGEEPELDAVAN